MVRERSSTSETRNQGINDPASNVSDDGPTKSIMGEPASLVMLLLVLGGLQQRLPLLLLLPPALPTSNTPRGRSPPTPRHSQGAPESMSCRALSHLCGLSGLKWGSNLE